MSPNNCKGCLRSIHGGEGQGEGENAEGVFGAEPLYTPDPGRIDY
jgi:hypothetical protein